MAGERDRSGLFAGDKDRVERSTATCGNPSANGERSASANDERSSSANDERSSSADDERSSSANDNLSLQSLSALRSMSKRKIHRDEKMDCSEHETPAKRPTKERELCRDPRSPTGCFASRCVAHTRVCCKDFEERGGESLVVPYSPRRSRSLSPGALERLTLSFANLLNPSISARSTRCTFSSALSLADGATAGEKFATCVSPESRKRRLDASPLDPLVPIVRDGHSSPVKCRALKATLTTETIDRTSSSSDDDRDEDRPLSHCQSRGSVDASMDEEQPMEQACCATRDSPMLFAWIAEDDETASEKSLEERSREEVSEVQFLLMASNRNRRTREAERARRELQINTSHDSAFYEPTESEHGRLSDETSSPEIEDYDIHS